MKAARIIAETERLTIRLLTEPDIPVLASIWADAQVTRFMGGPRIIDEVSDSFRRDLAAPPLQLDLWPVVDRNSERIVGHCGLLPKTVNGRNEVELVYVIAATCWGCGFATESAVAIRDYGFHTLSITRLVSLIEPAHVASERVALKVGMAFEAETVRPSGKTMKVYAIAKSF